MTWADLSEVLWRERELLSVLLFKLEEEQLVLESGRTRWLSRATNEVEIVMEEVRRCEVGRAVEVDMVAGPLGLEPSVSLGALCSVAPEPWSELLRDHRRAFLELTRDIEAIAEGNRALLAAGYRSIRETLLRVHDPKESGYDALGRVAIAPLSSRLVDEVV